jgi:uncharacterized damage-inducible protein DinB
MSNTERQYPIGTFQVPDPIQTHHRQSWIESIISLPGRLEKAVGRLEAAQLDTPYRTVGWTVRQLIHHIADSHMNAYIRLKLGITEQKPTIRPYDQDAWALLPDSELPIEPSLGIIRHLHQRWACLLEFNRNWERTIYHPEYQVEQTLDELTGYYAWHSEHHLAQIVELIDRKGW